MTSLVGAIDEGANTLISGRHLVNSTNADQTDHMLMVKGAVGATGLQQCIQLQSSNASVGSGEGAGVNLDIDDNLVAPGSVPPRGAFVVQFEGISNYPIAMWPESVGINGPPSQEYSLNINQGINSQGSLYCPNNALFGAVAVVNGGLFNRLLPYVSTKGGVGGIATSSVTYTYTLAQTNNVLECIPTASGMVITLDTPANYILALPITPLVNDSIEFWVVNGSSSYSVAVSTTQSVVGSATIAVSTSAHFCITFTAVGSTPTFSLVRLT